MGKKILFVDLDGTLLKDDTCISEGSRNAVRKLLEQGNYIALATGRDVGSARRSARELGIDRTGCYIIAYNGAVIYDCSADTILAERRLPIGCAEYLASEAQKAGIHIQAYGEDYVLAMSYTKELDYYIKKTRMRYRIEPDIWMIDEPPKMMLIDLEHDGKLEKFRQKHLAWEKDKCTSFFSHPEYLEYCPLGITKGYGVECLTRILNLPHESTVAVGNQENDITMIQSAYIGCAMKNADPAVKTIADYVTSRDNEEDGVAEVIDKFILS